MRPEPRPCPASAYCSPLALLSCKASPARPFSACLPSVPSSHHKNPPLVPPPGALMRSRITGLVNETLSSSGISGVRPLSEEEVLELIDRGGSQGGKQGSHWVLDPIDGTRGFVGMRQYAVCLGLLHEGEVVLGVLGCPNMPKQPLQADDGGESAASRSGSDAVRNPAGEPSALAVSPAVHCRLNGLGPPQVGVILAAARGQGATKGSLFGAMGVPSERIHVGHEDGDWSSVRFMESYESRHSSHGEPKQNPPSSGREGGSGSAGGSRQNTLGKRPAFSWERAGAGLPELLPRLDTSRFPLADMAAAVAKKLGIAGPSLRLDSQAKYGALSRGDAAVFMRFPPAAYREKIWDHAAGVCIVEEAGGRVTDAAGKPLDFSQGRYLALNLGIVAAPANMHADIIRAIQEVQEEGVKL